MTESWDPIIVESTMSTVAAKAAALSVAKKDAFLVDPKAVNSLRNFTLLATLTAPAISKSPNTDKPLPTRAVRESPSRNHLIGQLIDIL